MTRPYRRRKTTALNLTKRHGMDAFDYVSWFKRQDGRCAICRNPPAANTVLQWDHDHGHCPGANGCRECVRGLLCGTCNTRLAIVENTVRFSIAPFLAYLRAWTRANG